MKWKPQDVIAVIVIVGAISLLWQGIDTTVGWALIVIVAAYYGIDLSPWFKIGRNKKTGGGAGNG